MFFRFLIFLLLPLLVGCAGTVRDAADTSSVPEEQPSTEVIEQKATPPRGQQEPAPSVAEGLSEELVYSILVAEVAAQRGDLHAAYDHYLHVAQISGDSVGAEQAVRIAVYLKDLDKAIAAVEQWVQLEPNHLPGRTLAVMLFIQLEAFDKAYEQLEALVSISEEQGDDGFLRAVAAISQVEDREVGLRLIRRLVIGYQDEPRARYALALAAIGAEAFDEAEAEVRGLLDSYPDRAKVQALLSNILSSKGDREGALQVLEEALQETPEERALILAYARLLMESERLAEAYQQFKKLEQQTGHDSDVLYTLGVLALELEYWQEGRDYLLEVFESGKRQGEAAYYIGYSHESQRDVEEALNWYAEVPDGNQWVEARIRMAVLLADQREIAKARELLNRLRSYAPDRAVEFYLVEGEILKGEQQLEEAIELYNQAVAGYPFDDELLYARALTAAVLGLLDIMEQDLMSILKRSPNNADALNALGYTLADQTERYQEAKEYIEKAFALKPNSPAILDSMGWIRFRLGEYQEALKYLTQAMEMMPDGEIAAHLGEVLWELGDREQALEVWRGTLKHDPHNKPLLRTMERFQVE